jgi:hypothetical protein
MSSVQRRRVERVQLAQPLVARLGATPVVLVDVSVFGARIEHATPLTRGAASKLTFRWGGDEISVDCTIVRSRLERFSTGADGLTVYHSGLEFAVIPADTRVRLKGMLSQFISRALEEQKLNARGVLPQHDEENMPVFRGDQLAATSVDRAQATGAVPLPMVRIAKQTGYVCYIYDRGMWRSKRTLDPAQPDEGFTISASEVKAQADMLCQAYAKADAEGRRIIRLFAELSILEGGGTPPGRFEP